MLKKTNAITTLIILVVLGFSLSVLSANAQSRLTERSRLSLTSLGSVRLGMTVEGGSRAAGTPLVQTSSGGEEWGCLYYKPQGGPDGVSFMVIDGKIVRIEILSNRNITTLSGAKIGDTEEKILSLYPGQIEVTPHPYVGGPPRNGHYLTFVPRDARDRNYRLIFETSNNRVTRFRSGQLPEVEYIEGCL